MRCCKTLTACFSMENWSFRRKEHVMPCCGTPLALFCNRHGMLWSESPLPNKRMHRQGGGRAEFAQNVLRRETPQSSGGGPKVGLAPEKTAPVWIQAEIEN